LVKVIYKILVHDHQYEKWDAKKFYDNRIKAMGYKKQLSIAG